MAPDSPEDCLREAEECDRLAGLSQTVATRQILQSVAFHWRKLAERAAERVNERLNMCASRPAAGTMTGAPALVVEDETLLAETPCDPLLAAAREPAGTRRKRRHRSQSHRKVQD
jgi:hypothetical protein